MTRHRRGVHDCERLCQEYSKSIGGNANLHILQIVVYESC